MLATKLSTGGEIEGISPEEKGLSPAIVQLIGSLQQLLSHSVATHKMGACLIVSEWAGCPREHFLSVLTNSLTQQNGYEELSPFLLALQKDCHVRNFILHLNLFFSCIKAYLSKYNYIKII